MTREDAARRFAEAMGWTQEFGHWIDDPSGELVTTAFYSKVDEDGGVEPEDEIIFPASDAPLPEQLEFVGRVAEALPEWKLTACGWHADSWSVQFSRQSGDNGCESFEWSEDDPAWAAMLAAVAAKESGT